MVLILIGLLITIATIIPVITQMKHHPRGLIVCFFAEMWERFSYYGMRALLIYYVTTHFLFPDDKASSQYGSYATLVYLLPLVGGVVADRWLGTRKAIVFGGLLLVAGHFGMAFEGKPNQQTLKYNNAVYEFVETGKDSEGKRILELKVGEKTFKYGPNKDGGMEFEGVSATDTIPAVMPKGTYELGVKKITPWAENMFFLSISLIIMGVGFLKPNISTIVGQLYPEKDPRRDGGFQLYYYGINLGAFWATILCGYLGQKFGWWAGFGLAGVGMLVGLVMFVGGKALLEGKGEPPNPEALKEKMGGIITRENLIYLLGVLAVPLIYFIVQKNKLVGYSLAAGSVAVLSYVIFNMITKLKKEENFRLLLAMLLTLGSVVFFTLFEQAGSSLSLFAERNSTLNIIPSPFALEMFGKQFAFASSEQLALLTNLRPDHVHIDMGLTPAQTQSFNAGFILIFAPMFSALFTWLASKNIDPDPVKKFAFAMVCVGLGFLVLVWGKGAADSAFRLPLIFLFVTYLFHTWGELALSPVGLSQQTKLSPTFLVSTMMAIWFLGSAGAHFVAGIISSHAGTETVGGEVLDPKAALDTSLQVFETIGLWGIYIGIGFFVLSFFVSKWAYGANDTTKEVK